MKKFIFLFLSLFITNATFSQDDIFQFKVFYQPYMPFEAQPISLNDTNLEIRTTHYRRTSKITVKYKQYSFFAKLYKSEISVCDSIGIIIRPYCIKRTYKANINIAYRISKASTNESNNYGKILAIGYRLRTYSPEKASDITLWTKSEYFMNLLKRSFPKRTYSDYLKDLRKKYR